jgi:hypothetical protein
MFCCFRKLAGMGSFSACDPKIASEYFPPSPKPEHLPPFPKPEHLLLLPKPEHLLLLPKPENLPLLPKPEHLPLLPKPENLPLLQRGPGGFNDRLKKTPKISPFCKGGRRDFHSRQVMVETEAVMEKLYRVVTERAGGCRK